MKFQSRPRSTHIHKKINNGIDLNCYTLSVIQKKNSWVSTSLNTSVNKYKNSKEQHTNNPQKYLNKQQAFNKQQIPVSFYFDPKLRKRIIHDVVDNYLQSDLLIPQPKYPHTQRTQKKSRISKTAEGNRKKYISKSQLLKTPSQTCSIFNQIDDANQSLPTIEEFSDNTLKRPQSQGKKNHEYQNNLLVRKRKSQKYRTISMINDSAVSFNLQTSQISRSSRQSSKYKMKNCCFFSFSKDDSSQNDKNIYKEFSQQGKNSYQKQVRTKKMGAKVLWQTNPSKPYTIIFKNIQPVVQQIYYKIKRKHADEYIYKIIPYQTYEHLFANQNEQLIDIITQISKQLINLENKIITNSIRPDNIYVCQQKQVYIGDWTHVGIRQSLKVNAQTFIKYHDPLFRQKNGRILFSPEYLAPQILMAESVESFDDLWTNKSSSSDVWSLGCLIFQLLTLIPLGASQKYSVKNRNVLRRGLLTLKNYDVSQFIRKQKLFVQQYQRILNHEAKQIKLSNKVQEILRGCLKMKKEERLSPNQILSILQ